MLARDLLIAPRPEGLAEPEVDPLTEADALLEAQVLEILFDVKRATLGVLFELRTAAIMTESNAGVLVAQGVHSFSWQGEQRDTKLTAWTVLTSEVKRTSEVSLDLQFHPHAQITLTASSLHYTNCNVATIGDVPPDYSEDFASTHPLLANWESKIDLVSGSSR